MRSHSEPTMTRRYPESARDLGVDGAGRGVDGPSKRGVGGDGKKVEGPAKWGVAGNDRGDNGTNIVVAVLGIAGSTAVDCPVEAAVTVSAGTSGASGRG